MFNFGKFSYCYFQMSYMVAPPLQLPPVGDAALYKRTTKTAHGFNLYRKFTDVVFFDRIQRQEGEDQKEFREQLERLGKGQPVHRGGLEQVEGPKPGLTAL